MAHEIVLLDGCKDFAPGKVLAGVLDHMASIVGTIHADKTAGQLDMEGYNVVRDLVRRSFDSHRGQIQIEALVGVLDYNSLVQSKPKEARFIVLVPEDLYALNGGHPTNWVHGAYFSKTSNSKDVVVISTARFYTNGKFDPIHFRHVMAHELGHMFGATKKGRRNTYELLGPHCSNDCIMRQDVDVGSGKDRAHDMHRKGTTFCNDCRREMIKLHRPR